MQCIPEVTDGGATGAPGRKLVSALLGISKTGTITAVGVLLRDRTLPVQ